MRVVADTGKCIGAGQCVLRAPEVFDQSEDTGLVVLREASPRAALHETVRRAVSFCPSGAIAIEEEVKVDDDRT